MADIFVGGTFRPGGPFPFTEDTDNKGGLHVVADVTARDAIITSRKKVGMFAVTQTDNKLWQLTALPNTWTEFTGGGGSSVATWATTRFFAVDFDNGNDANAGFSDTSLALAGAVAKKTWLGFLAILPTFGNNKQFEVAVRTRAAGASYGESLDITGRFGYARHIIRGTDTIATASCTAFAGDANDEIAAGGIVAAGTNTAGYKFTKISTPVLGATNTNPVEIEHDGSQTFVAGEKIFISGTEDGFDGGLSHIRQVWTIQSINDATHFTLTRSNAATFRPWTVGGNIERIKVVKADDSAPVLTAEVALLGKRVRGDSATTTVANRNLTRTILANSTNTIVLDLDPAAIDPADIWYIEEPGVAFTSVTVGTGEASTLHNTNNNSLIIAGIRSLGAVTATDAPIGLFFSFCEGTSFTINHIGSIRALNSYQGISGVSRTTGIGFRSSSGTTVSDCLFTSLSSFYNTGGLVALNRLISYAIIGPGYIGAGLNINSCGTAGTSEGLAAQQTKSPNIGSSPDTATRKPIRIVRANTSDSVIWTTSHGYVANVQFENGGSFRSAITIAGLGSTMMLEMIGDQRNSPLVGLRIQRGGAGVINFRNKTVEFQAPNGGADAEIWIEQKNSGTVIDGSTGYQHYSTDFDLAAFRDPNGLLIYQTSTGSEIASTGFFLSENLWGVSLETPSFYRNDSTITVPLLFSLIRLSTTITGFPIDDNNMTIPAQADSYANAAGIVGVCLTTQINGDLIPAVGSGACWIVTDTLATKGDMMYLSTVNAGQAMNTIPTLSGTNQKLRLGFAQKVVSHQGRDYALINLSQMELIPVDADGEP